MHNGQNLLGVIIDNIVIHKTCIPESWKETKSTIIRAKYQKVNKLQIGKIQTILQCPKTTQSQIERRDN